MEPVRIGIMGCANIAVKYIIPALQLLQEKYSIAGIASRDYNKAKQIAERFNSVPFDSYNAILDKNNFDLVYIPLPNALHKKWSLAALDAGIHVIAEKSLTCSFKDTAELISNARAKGLGVIETFQFRFHPQLEFILKLLENDEIGELRCIRSSFGFPPFENSDNIRYNKELGGGALLDAGAYTVKITQLFLGNDISVKASKLFYDKKTGVDIWGGAFIEDNNSPLFSEVAFGFDNYYQCNLELWGSKGKITADRIFTAPVDCQPVITIENNRGKRIEKLPASNHFIKMFEYLYDLLPGKNYESEYIQSLTQSRIMDEIRSSSCNG